MGKQTEYIVIVKPAEFDPGEVEIRLSRAFEILIQAVIAQERPTQFVAESEEQLERPGDVSMAGGTSTVALVDLTFLSGGGPPRFQQDPLSNRACGFVE